MTTYVLVHGAWHGGWCWRRVAPLLAGRGHRVFAPTQTGLGERAHLLTRAVNLSTFIADIAGVFAAEELDDVVLVGHSFGGIAISGVAERMPGRVRHLVYLDSLILQPGRRVFDTLPAEIVAQRVKAAAATGGLAVPPPPAASFGVTDPADIAWLERRMTPHPLGTYEEPMPIAGPVGAGRPCTYVVATAPLYAPLEATRRWAKSQANWRWAELATGHDVMVTAPAALADLLLAL
jgi:pimeloyl-ACP methyl ester carboxylesterase